MRSGSPIHLRDPAPGGPRRDPIGGALRHGSLPGLRRVQTPEVLAATLTSVIAVCAAGCGVEGALSATASLGGDTVGQRGTVLMLFVNNTPHRALLTAGLYDPSDQEADPQFIQFGTNTAGNVLEGHSSSEILELPCARLFSVGTQALVNLVESNNDAADLQPEALIEGVGFSSAALGEEGDDVADQGFAAPAALQLGADFPCGALLIVRLEINDLGPEPFLVDFSFIPSTDTR